MNDFAPSWPIHGDPDRDELAAYGLDPDTVLDFSVCVNPYGPSPSVGQALLDVPLNRYPDPKATILRDALVCVLRVAGAEVLRSPGSRRRLPGLRSTSAPATPGLSGCDCLPPDHILVGNGVSELIWLTCLAFLKPSDQVLIPEPTYGEYARSAAMMGASVVSLPTLENDRFLLSSDKVAEALHRWQPRMMFLCNPNNPTGNLLSGETITGWAEDWPECLFVIDEAYMAFAEPDPQASDSSILVPKLRLGTPTREAPLRESATGREFAAREDSQAKQSFASGIPKQSLGTRESLTSGSNVLLLRSMTKDFALAGLRLGYAVGPVEVIEALHRVQPPWSVNAVAQAAGLAALSDRDYLRRTLQLLRKAKACLRQDLADIALPPLPSATNYFLVRVGDGAGFRRALLQHGILVRDCASFGLPEFVRIATRLPEENRRLIEAIQEIRR